MRSIRERIKRLEVVAVPARTEQNLRYIEKTFAYASKALDAVLGPTSNGEHFAGIVRALDWRVKNKATTDTDRHALKLVAIAGLGPFRTTVDLVACLASVAEDRDGRPGMLPRPGETLCDH
ncbi:hypothetical protein E4K72_02970 [Oxalobacteraceae bacterium OM1]|nr:hypothetical protein E4K72_02970 [Oxalobacteraceae bacterium OM1]